MAASIALCLIVRDEAEMLPAFLESVRGAWDELVAVDTGSRDATPAQLAAAGARGGTGELRARESRATAEHRSWDRRYFK